jgi:hypothetical protein
MEATRSSETLVSCHISIRALHHTATGTGSMKYFDLKKNFISERDMSFLTFEGLGREKEGLGKGQRPLKKALFVSTLLFLCISKEANLAVVRHFNSTCGISKGYLRMTVS